MKGLYTILSIQLLLVVQVVFGTNFPFPTSPPSSLSSSLSFSNSIQNKPEYCGYHCTTDADCVADDRYYNPCSYCSRAGICEPMCGVACFEHEQCRSGGANPCNFCSNVTNTCVNPKPLCGSFCGGDDNACKTYGSYPCNTSSSCCTCSSDWSKGCVKSSSGCGTVCSGQHQCSGSSTCPECVGFYCSQKASCGQVCISSGQCQTNPGSCHACIGAVCENTRPCGGSCGSDDWCGSGCPVCGMVATCVSHREYQEQVEQAKQEGNLQFYLEKAQELRNQVLRKATEQTFMNSPQERLSYTADAVEEYLQHHEIN